MNDALVSVIVATYRREKELKRALDSLALQTYRNIEIVVIDDNDDIKWNDIVKNIIETFKNGHDDIDIKYIQNHPNQGSAKSRNIGINICKGDYVTFLDDDDLYKKEKIEKQLRDMLIKEADYGITDLYLYNEKEELIDKRIRSYIKSMDMENLIKYHILYHMTGTDTLMFKSEYLRNIGAFPEIDVGDEFYLVEKAILGKGKFVYSDHCYVKAYVHNGSDSGLSSGEKKINGENLLYDNKKKYFKYLDKDEVKYLKTRHYAVIAFADLRRGYYLSFLKHAIMSFACSPINSLRILKQHKG